MLILALMVLLCKSCMLLKMLRILCVCMIVLLYAVSCSRPLEDGDIINVDVTVSFCRHTNKLKDITANVTSQSEQCCPRD